MMLLIFVAVSILQVAGECFDGTFFSIWCLVERPAIAHFQGAPQVPANAAVQMRGAHRIRSSG